MPALDLQTLANLAEIFGALTVVGGLFFAITQLREFRRQRRDAVAAELMRSFYNPELARAVQRIRRFPDGIGAAELRGRGTEDEIAAILVCTTYETMGLLVYRGIAPFSMVRELTGGLAVSMYRKLEVWLADMREELGQPSWAEWYEWLANRLHEAAEQDPWEPAFRRHAGWKPRS
ncbi:MAG: DUF4760 domain-containing protein [Myxococcota bacterium]